MWTLLKSHHSFTLRCLFKKGRWHHSTWACLIFNWNPIVERSPSHLIWSPCYPLVQKKLKFSRGVQWAHFWLGRWRPASGQINHRGEWPFQTCLSDRIFFGGGVPSSTTARVFSFPFTANVLLKWYSLFDKVGMPTGSFSATVLSTYITWVTFKYEWYLFEYNVNSELLF